MSDLHHALPIVGISMWILSMGFYAGGRIAKKPVPMRFIVGMMVVSVICVAFVATGLSPSSRHHPLLFVLWSLANSLLIVSLLTILFHNWLVGRARRQVPIGASAGS